MCRLVQDRALLAICEFEGLHGRDFMDLRRVRYFVAVAEQLHFGRAAEKMHVVQSAVSQQIKRLEEELGTELFDRSRSEVQLTEAGRQMLPECRELLAKADDVVRVAKGAAMGSRGKINFGFVDNSICSLLPPIVRQYRQGFPGVELNLSSMWRDEQEAALIDAKIDVGLIPGPILQSSLESEVFLSCPLYAALPAHHPLAEYNSLSLDMLSEEPFVLYSSEVRSRLLEIILAACATRSFTPKVVQNASQMHTLLALVDAGLGITLVPAWVVQPGESNFVFRPLVDGVPSYDLFLAWKPGGRNPALQGFLGAARSVAKGLKFPR